MSIICVYCLCNSFEMSYMPIFAIYIHIYNILYKYRCTYIYTYKEAISLIFYKVIYMWKTFMALYSTEKQTSSGLI